MSQMLQDEFDQSRFSTPDNELDDHRFQPDSLPPADRAHQRRGTLRSFVADRPALQQINRALQEQGTVAKDYYESAIVDGDDKSDAGSIKGNRSSRSRRDSVSPVVARRAAFRRNQNEERHVRSGSSSTRSGSPPNSVDAFAGRTTRPRAGTAGTAASLSPSMAAHLRSSSSDTHKRNRTQSGGQVKEAEDDDLNDDDHSSRSSTSTEDDVCFPQPQDDGRPYTIDFDELHEFVEKQRSESVCEPFQNRRSSYSCTTSGGHKPSKDVPKITTEAPTPLRKGSGPDIDGSRSDVDEKLDKITISDEKEEANEATPKAAPETGNRWSFFSSELEESVHAPQLGDLLLPGENFQQLFELSPSGGCWWLDMLHPTEDEVDVICKAFGIHGLTREDIAEQETREKVELFRSYYFVCFRSFFQMDKKSEHYMEPVTVYAVVFREGILTFTYSASPHATNVRKRMGKLRDYVALSADWICYALIDDIVDTFAPVIRDVEVETDSIEDGVFTTRPEDSSALLRQIGECRKKVMSLIRLLGGKADVIKGFSKRCTEQYEVAPRREVGMYLSDVQDHVVTMMSNLNHFEKMLSRSHANYLAQLNVTNLVQGNAINEVLGKVTFVATILVPLNLVCGLFGMNVHVPGQDVENLHWWFGILGVILACVASAFAFAKKKGFI